MRKVRSVVVTGGVLVKVAGVRGQAVGQRRCLAWSPEGKADVVSCLGQPESCSPLQLLESLQDADEGLGYMTLWKSDVLTVAQQTLLEGSPGLD